MRNKPKKIDMLAWMVVGSQCKFPLFRKKWKAASYVKNYGGTIHRVRITSVAKRKGRGK